MRFSHSRSFVVAASFAAVIFTTGCQGGATIGGGSPTPRTTATPVSGPSAVAVSPPPPSSLPAGTPTATASPAAAPTSSPVATPSTSATPATAATDTVYASIGSAGVEAFTTAGTPLETFASATGADEVALDAAGNTYVLSSAGFTIAVSRYAIGAQSPNATYDPTSPQPQLLFAGPNGTLVVAGAGSDANGNPTGVYDFWDPGVTGAPSRTLTYPIETLGLLNGAIATDGTFYVPYADSSNQVRYDVIAPGASGPERTIVEAIAPANSNFSIGAMAVGADGTLYVAEWAYAAADADAGLYVYPAAGSESSVTGGASNPTSVALDAAGNVYVTNSNAIVGPDDNLTSDTLHALSIFSPHAGALTNTITSGLDDPQDLAVDDDGTAYVVDDANADQTTSPIEVVRPSAAAATTFAATADATNVVLFDGTDVRSIRARGSHAASVRALRFHHRLHRRR